MHTCKCCYIRYTTQPCYMVLPWCNPPSTTQCAAQPASTASSARNRLPAQHGSASSAHHRGIPTTLPARSMTSGHQTVARPLSAQTPAWPAHPSSPCMANNSATLCIKPTITYQLPAQHPSLTPRPISFSLATRTHGHQTSHHSSLRTPHQPPPTPPAKLCLWPSHHTPRSAPAVRTQVHPRLLPTLGTHVHPE